MSQTDMIDQDMRERRAGLLARSIAFLYGVFAYILFLGTILYAIGFVSNLVVPKTLDTGTAGPIAEALIVNLVLMSIFALQHSVMARKPFKQWWTQYVPKAIERSTYVLLASLALVLLFWQWRPMPAVVWQIDDPQIAMALTGLSLFGWVIVFTSTFLINHFELFGLHQVANDLAGRTMPAPRFRTPLYYNFVRHPLYASELIWMLGFVIDNPSGWNIGLWLCDCVLQFSRACAEERFLSVDPIYSQYRARVKYRLIPLVI